MKKLIVIVSIISIWVFNSCMKSDIKTLSISDSSGLSWIITQQADDFYDGAKYSYGITFYRSGKAFWFYYDKDTGRESPIKYGCNDCGDPLRIKDILLDWKISGDTLFLGQEKYSIENISEDSLVLMNKGLTRFKKAI